jgi:predicted CopG family antitoxin
LEIITLVKDNKQRVNIMLDEEQRRFLSRMAEEQKSSMSEIIREIIDAERKKKQAHKLAQAADALADAYRQDEELNAFSALDGEDFA